MCTHPDTFRTTHNTVVCTCCGLERVVPLTITQTQPVRDMCPFPTGYSKLKRFSKILDGVLYPTPAKADSNMLEYLYSRKFDSIPDLLAAMKQGKMRDKRYTSIHLFAKLFVTNYEAPPARNYSLVRTAILRAFEDIEFSHWRVCPCDQFFNYNYLLCVLLDEYGLGDLVKYIKNLRCKRRRLFYKNQLCRLYVDIASPITSARSERPSPANASETRKPPSELWDGPPKRHARKRSLSEIGETLLRQYILARTGENRSDSAVSYQLRRGGTP